MRLTSKVTPKLSFYRHVLEPSCSAKIEHHQMHAKSMGQKNWNSKSILNHVPNADEVAAYI
jgi:hypothetical protein